MPSLCYDGCKARRIPYPLPDGQHFEIGDFSWGPEEANGRRHLYIRLPGDLHQTAIPVVLGEAPEDRRTWGWDGNLDVPSIKGSFLHWYDQDKGIAVWHGALDHGDLICVDAIIPGYHWVDRFYMVDGIILAEVLQVGEPEEPKTWVANKDGKTFCVIDDADGREFVEKYYRTFPNDRRPLGKLDLYPA